MPLLVVYFAGHGLTDVVIPNVFGLRKLLNIEHVSGVLKLGSLSCIDGPFHADVSYRTDLLFIHVTSFYFLHQ